MKTRIRHWYWRFCMWFSHRPENRPKEKGMKPIIFNSEMVRAILDGKKTQTRRVIKPQPIGKPGKTVTGQDTVWYHWNHGKANQVSGVGEWVLKQGLGIRCPYGQVGDRLWVRETWAGQDFAICCENDRPNYKSKVDGLWHPVIHKAGKENSAWGLQGEPKWKSPYHMFKTSTRITLEITEVRVERLQEISEKDAKAEGLVYHDGFSQWYTSQDTLVFGHDTAFKILWDSLNAKRGYGWEANPWVWVISFRRA